MVKTCHHSIYAFNRTLYNTAIKGVSKIRYGGLQNDRKISANVGITEGVRNVRNGSGMPNSVYGAIGGPQSVPMCGDWYARNCTYGKSSVQLSYPSLRASVNRGIRIFVNCGRRRSLIPGADGTVLQSRGQIFVAQAMHHDNFFNYDSKVNANNSAKSGRKRISANVEGSG